MPHARLSPNVKGVYNLKLLKANIPFWTVPVPLFNTPCVFRVYSGLLTLTYSLCTLSVVAICGFREGSARLDWVIKLQRATQTVKPFMTAMSVAAIKSTNQISIFSANFAFTFVHTFRSSLSPVANDNFRISRSFFSPCMTRFCECKHDSISSQLISCGASGEYKGLKGGTEQIMTGGVAPY